MVLFYIYAFFIFANTHTFRRENNATNTIVTTIPLIKLNGKIAVTTVVFIASLDIAGEFKTKCKLGI